MSADQQPRRGVDLMALVAGLVFLAFSIVSVTVGVFDLPRLGAAPLWLILIGAGILLLVSELRSRRHTSTGTSATSPEQAAWERDTNR